MRTRALSDKLDRLCCFIFVYIFLTTLSLISVAKSGSSNSYFIEWVFAWSIVIGLFLRQLIKYALGSPGSAKGRNPARGMVGSCRPLSRFDYPVMLAVLLYQAWVISPPSYKKEITDVAHQEQQRELLRRVQDASKPVISDDMVAILNSGKEVVWEAAIFAELTALNLWDEGPFIQMIQSNDFAFFVTGGERGNPVFDSRYNAAVLEAIESAYPRTEPLAGYTIRLPPE